MATLPLSAEVYQTAGSTAAQPAGRWLHVVSHTDPRYGGLSSAVPSLAAWLRSQQGVPVRLAAFCAPGEEHKPADTQRDHIDFWPTSRVAWVTDTKLKAKFAEAVRAVDGVHVHGLWEQSTAVACSEARRLGKPYVLSAHGMLEPWALAAKRWKKRIYAAMVERENVAGAACLHALTAAEAEQYRRFGATGPIAVVPNAVQLPEDSHPDEFYARFPELRSKRIVLFLSRLHPKKGLDVLIEAWAGAGKRHPEAQLVIAGPDSEGLQAKLMAQAEAAGIADRVSFTGMLTGSMKWSALEAAECYVLPSRSEGLSMALLEAMGLGVPVIATRACNMPEISTAEAGWEIDLSIEALSSALGDLLDHPAEQNWVKGRNGARLVGARYSPAQVARQMAEVYEFALTGRKPSTVAIQREGAR